MDSSSAPDSNNFEKVQQENYSKGHGDKNIEYKDHPGLYYGVHIPAEAQLQDNDGYINVFEDKIEALKVVKKYKKARFKAFNFYHEAAEFAVHGAEFPNNNMTVEGPLFQKPTQENSSPAVGEKPSQFRGPKSQDLVRLRKGIENGDSDFVHNTIWENPRYLVSVGDTPSILQEGSRYNALHVAAKAKNHAMCELILSTITDINFIKYLYGEDQNQDALDRAKILLDLYLNTPDKGLNETPLHFAVKFGALKVVELLVSYPQCDRNLRNKYGKTASEIICDRTDGNDLATLKHQIHLLLQDNYYVPVLRSEDNCMPPVIGEPFSPKSPLNLNVHPLSPRLEIHAFAGPMNKTEADKFRKIWKTPPRSIGFAKRNQINDISTLKRKDHEKGLERIGRDLADQYEVGWKEYWPFLESFIDLASTEGLDLLEVYLSGRFNAEYHLHSNLTCSPVHSISPPVQKSGISSPTASNQVDSPITELCNAMQACSIKDNNFKKLSKQYTELTENMQFLNSDDFSPFLFVEKACQVFAQRFAKDIFFLFEDECSNTSILETQVKQLQLLITSYMDDCRFISVDFHLVHSRLGSLIKCKLKNLFKEEADVTQLCKSLEDWLESCSKNFDCFSSDDESAVVKHSVPPQKKSTSKNKQVMCVLQCVLSSLNNKLDQVNDNCKTEDEVMTEWSYAKPCSCVLLSRNSRKHSNNKRGNSFRFSYKSISSLFRNGTDLSRKLSFDSEEFSNDVKNNDVKDYSSSDEEYYTPPSSPSLLEEMSEDEEEFDETHLPDVDVFLEGDTSTKLDCTVYNALQRAQSKLNSKDYPNVYKWYHTVSLYSNSERESWTNPTTRTCIDQNIDRSFIDSPAGMSTPTCQDKSMRTAFTPPRSWLRITGANSPKASLKSVHANVSFNLLHFPFFYFLSFPHDQNLFRLMRMKSLKSREACLVNMRLYFRIVLLKLLYHL